MPRSPSGASARPSPRVSIKSLELNALHTSRIQDMVHLNGNRSNVLDARMRRKSRDHVEGEIAALELRIGIEHHRNVDAVCDGAEVRLDLRVLERKVGFENGEDAVGAEFLIILRLIDCIRF